MKREVFHPDEPVSGGNADALDRVEAYMDGALTGEALAAFERDMTNDPALRREVEAARRIEASLKRVYAPGAAPALPGATGRHAAQTEPTALRLAGTEAEGSAPAAGTARVPWHRQRPVRWAAAAAIALTAVGVGQHFYVKWADRQMQAQIEPSTPAEVYFTLVGAGFEPAWVCKDDAEFKKSVNDRLGTPLLASATPGLQVLGWAYPDSYSGSPLSEKAMILLCRVANDPVVVIIDRLREDRALESGDEHLNLFRREVGKLVVYEVTPLDEAVASGALFVPG